MKKLMIGLVLGVVLSGGAALVAVPGLKQGAYDKGYATGNKEGMEKGTAAGIAEGVAQITNAQAARHSQDSVTAAQRYQAARRRAAMSKPKAKAKPIQNWHVIDGKIDQPIPDEAI